MKPFRIYLQEQQAYSYANSILLKYTNGDMPDEFDNEQANPKDLFTQINQLFKENGIDLVILKDGVPFDGTGIVLNTDANMHFNLQSKSDENITKKLHVELKKNDNGNYFFTFLRIE
jgi:hypothetical protein